MRPVLAATEKTQIHVDHLLNSGSTLVPDSKLLWPVAKATQFLFRKATIATLPRWMRKMSGVKQSRVTDVLVTAVMKLGMRLMANNVAVQCFLIRTLSPLTAPVLVPILRGTAPANPVTWTPEDARNHYGVVSPTEQYAAIQASRSGNPLPACAPRDGEEPLLAFA
jgi:hypothetical protein